MSYRKTAAPWLYVAGGAALGLVAWGAAARTRQRRTREALATDANQEQSEFAGDVSDLEVPMQEALAASAHAHGMRRPLSEELAREIFGHVEERRATPSNQRHELSSLVGPHAIAPADSAIGEELVDPGAIEVPLGQSADPQIDRELSHSKLIQPDSSGASLQRSDFEGDARVDTLPMLDEPDETTLTARPTKESRPPEDAYDAVAPDDLASEWLSRATEASTLPSEDDLLRVDMIEVLQGSDMSMVGQGSMNAASPEQLEAAALADPDGSDEDEPR